MSYTIKQMKQRKQELGYSYAEIAKRSGLPLGTVQKVLGGITRSPRHETLAALEKVLSPRSPGAPDGGGTTFAASGENSSAYNASAESSSAYNASTGSRSTYDYSPPDPAQFLAQDPSAQYLAAPDLWQRLLGKRQGQYTIQDRESLPEDLRTELIDGVIYLMASPTNVHQIISGQIYYQLCSFIYSRDGDCTPFIAPSDVRLDRDDFTVVQPDVYIVCGHDETDDDPKEEDSEEKNSEGENSEEENSEDGRSEGRNPGSARRKAARPGRTDPKYLAGEYHEGGPAFIAEVLSPSTKRRDMTIKAEKYRKAGVREYWIVDPKKERVITYLFGDDPDISIHTFDDSVPVQIYGGECVIDFAQIRERVNRYLR